MLADFLWYTLGEEHVQRAYAQLVDHLDLQVTELPIPNIAFYSAMAWAFNPELEDAATPLDRDSLNVMLGTPELNSVRSQSQLRAHWQDVLLRHARDLPSNPDNIVTLLLIIDSSEERIDMWPSNHLFSVQNSE